MAKKPVLPPLAFGQDVAVTQEDAQQFGDVIERAFPGLNAYEPLADKGQFRSRTAAVSMPQSKIVAAAISPTVVDRRNNQQLTFMLPYVTEGPSFCQVGSTRIQWGGRTGVFLPVTDERVLGDGTFRSHIMWHVDAQRLRLTAQAMLGSDDPVDLRLDDARALPETFGGVRSDAAIHAMLPLINLYSRHPDVLARLGLEELLYRQTVMLLRPDLLAHLETAHGQHTPVAARAHRAVGQLCEHLQGRLTERFTLTDMERFTGLSARALQYAFMQRFGCSPMQWLRGARLDHARRLVRDASGNLSITQLALEMGFSKPSEFSRQYRLRFGELPTDTRRTTAR